jgi:type I restriction enzyme S subunit
MKRYDSYKDSGVKWIGEIPSHWGVQPFGRHFQYGKGLPITKADLLPEGIAVISYGQIHSKHNSGTTMSDNLVRFVSPEYLKSNPQSLLCKNDFVFADTSEDIEGSGNCAFNDFSDNIFAGYHTVIARPVDLLYPRYYAYLFQSRAWKNQVQSLVDGVKVYSINKSILKKSLLLFPTLEEQKSIVSYLDSKISEIDDLLVKVGREIELLKEYKQAEIARVVLRGLNPDAPIKSSGISWIGDIPAHWSIRKIKFTFEERSEKNHPDEPVLCATQSQGVIPQSMYDNRVVVVNKGFENLKFVEVGDFVISLRSFQGGIEYAYYQGIISAAYTILRPNDFIDSGYARLLLKSHNFIQLLKTCVTGIREGQNINYDLLKNKYIPIPPKEEQKEIVKYIEYKTTEIDRLVVELTYQVEYLKEYKQKLIADVVTGKINVQNN